MTSRNRTSDASFSSSVRESAYHREDIEKLMDIEEEEKTYSKEIDLACSTEKKEVRIGEENTIMCRVGNQGNTLLSLEVCHEECEDVTLGISQSEEVRFSFSPSEPGKKVDLITVSGDAKAGDSVAYTVYDEPSIEIEILEAPSEVSYSDEFIVEFLLKSDSFSVPQDVVVTLVENNLEKSWTIEELTQNQKFSITLHGKDLSAGENDILVKASFADRGGAAYSTEQAIPVTLTDLSFLEQVIVTINSLLRGIVGIFS
jgi:hypothetical protein